MQSVSRLFFSQRKIASFLAIGFIANPFRPAQSNSPKGALRHIVVIYQENISFDHYFATYPTALNPPGEPEFHALPGTPEVDGLKGKLLTENPNFLNPENGSGRANPFRVSRTQAVSADREHAYQPGQVAYDGGTMDLSRNRWVHRMARESRERKQAFLRRPVLRLAISMGTRRPLIGTMRNIMR